jgi:hypothetical protein
MAREFSADGVSFRCPDGWKMEREDAEEGWTVTLQSPGTAFALIRLDRNMPDTADVAQTTLEALRADYPDLEAETFVDMLAGEMATGHEVHFFSLDLSVTCWTRSLYAGAGTLLVLCQVSDMEEAEYEPLLRAVCASLRVERE